MNVFSLLLRVLLCVSLVANGAGYAQASTRMQFEHAAHASNATPAQSSPVMVEDGDLPPCHRHAANASIADAAAAGHAGHLVANAERAKTPAAAPGDTQPGPDCCKGTSCDCACAHAYCPSIIALVPQVVPGQSDRVAVLSIDHPQPRLPQQIRPPIG